jgi:hypothetical protein
MRTPCSMAERLEYFAKSHLDCENNIKRTPCGLAFVTEWGSCRHAAGAAAILAVYARLLRKKNAARADSVLDFARKQVLTSTSTSVYVPAWALEPRCDSRSCDSGTLLR